jgi:hypothetical protein
MQKKKLSNGRTVELEMVESPWAPTITKKKIIYEKLKEDEMFFRKHHPRCALLSLQTKKKYLN